MANTAQKYSWQSQPRPDQFYRTDAANTDSVNAVVPSISEMDELRARVAAMPYKNWARR